MFKKIDIYIIKKLLSTYFVSIAIIMAIIIVIDYSEKIDDFAEREAPFRAILTYYCLLIPYFSNMFSSLFCFVSVLLVASKMGSNTEIIAILSCGISFKRILYPFMVSAFIIGSISLALNLFILPITNGYKLKYEAQYIGTSRTDLIENTRMFHSQIDKNTYIYIRYYDRSNDKASDFTLERVDTNQRLISKLSSDFAEWNTKKNKWDLIDYTMRTFNKDGSETFVEGKKIDTTINLTPKDFKIMKGSVETMNYFELNDFIKKEELAGSPNINDYNIEKFKRISFPFSSFILTLIGASLASRKTRGGIGMHMALGLMLAFTYIMFMQLSAEFSMKGGLDPLIACWIPNFIYMFIGIFLYIKAPK